MKQKADFPRAFDYLLLGILVVVGLIAVGILIAAIATGFRVP